LNYLDTSVLAAYYCPEPLSDEAESIVRASRTPAICDLTEVELFSALSRKVRTRELDATEAEFDAKWAIREWAAVSLGKFWEGALACRSLL